VFHEAPRLRGPPGWAPEDKGRGRRGNVADDAPTVRRRREALGGRGLLAGVSARWTSNDESGPSTGPHV